MVQLKFKNKKDFDKFIEVNPILKRFNFNLIFKVSSLIYSQLVYTYLIDEILFF